MKQFTVEKPGFNESIMIVETTDPAHADNVNASPKALIENDLYLKKQVEEAKEAVEEGAATFATHEEVRAAIDEALGESGEDEGGGTSAGEYATESEVQAIKDSLFDW